MKKLGKFSSRLLVIILSILLIVAAFLVLFIGIRGCENHKKEKWELLSINYRYHKDSIDI